MFVRVQLKNPDSNKIYFEHVGKKIKLPSIEFCQNHPGATLYIEHVTVAQVSPESSDENNHEHKKIA